jgi:CDP-glycerol glycerophosphotransferase (TagB/SpsB family)
VPQSKIINIGWGSSKYRSKHLNRGKSSEVLVASSPELTEKILTFLRFAKEINIKFSLRTHPQEQLNLQQMDLIGSLKNVSLDDSLDSEEAIAKFDYILGHNSSILFEAAGFGKTIMAFNTPEIPAVNSKQILKYGFHLISNPSDIEQVFKLPKTEPILNSNFYSIFEPNNFIKCLKE